MKVKYTNTLDIHYFANLEAGDTFYWHDKLYIKASPVSVRFVNESRNTANCMNLETFGIGYIKDTEEVARVASELMVSDYRRMN